MVARFGILVMSGLVSALLALSPATATPADEPLARFEDPICPGVIGLRVDAAEMLVGRVRQNLEAFGRRLAPASRCEANLIVGIVPSGKEFLSSLEREKPWLFAELEKEEQDALLAETSPARALLRVRVRTRDGLPVSRREGLLHIPQSETWMANSKIFTATRNDIVSALVLLDRDAVKGMTLDQLADYATFRALTRRLPETPEARSVSILSLFDGGTARPAGLTSFDRAYLGELYSGMPNIPGPARELALEQATGRDVFKQ